MPAYHDRIDIETHIISLLDFENGIKDECGLTWYGSNAVTTDDKKFGKYSLAIRGDVIHCPISSIEPMANQKEFSIGWWQRITWNDNYAGVVSSGYRGIIFCYFGNYSISSTHAFLVGNGSGWIGNQWIGVDASVWHHYLFSKSDNKIMAYIDGKQVASMDYSGFAIGFNSNLSIGQWDGHSVTGYMDNFFISSASIDTDFDIHRKFEKLDKKEYRILDENKENIYSRKE